MTLTLQPTQDRYHVVAFCSVSDENLNTVQPLF